MRQAIIAALPLVDADGIGDPSWQQRVWRAIERAEAGKRPNMRWFVGSAFASTCMLLIASWMVIFREPRVTVSKAELVPRQVERGAAPRIGHVGDLVTAEAAREADIRVYYGETLLRWCGQQVQSDGCAVRDELKTVKLETTEPGKYSVLIIAPRGDGGPLPAARDRSTDLTALNAARDEVQVHEFEVR